MTREENIYQEIMEFASQVPVINTHCHHYNDEEFVGFTLKKLINESYVAWVNPIPDDVEVPSQEWFDRMLCNNVFYWLERGIQQQYDTKLKLTRENFTTLSSMMEKAYRNPDFHLELMNRNGYRRILFDCYWNPGSDNGHPEIITPVFRVNMFFYGYSQESACHNGFNPIKRFGMEEPEDIDDYCQKVFEVLKTARKNGSVALKSALPYDRGLNLVDWEKSDANHAFLRCMKGTGELQDIEKFQGYMLARLCEMAAQLDLPFQMHTGLGKLVHSNAMWLQPFIESHPETKFVLLHGSYPWTDDMLALCHHYRNVYPDICWMPVLSTAFAERFLDDLLETSRADGICWGCDTWTSEESCGALLAARHVFAGLLSKKVVAGRIDLNDAMKVVRMIFFDNANRLYFDNQVSAE